jgi:hypothetical protein
VSHEDACVNRHVSIPFLVSEISILTLSSTYLDPQKLNLALLSHPSLPDFGRNFYQRFEDVLTVNYESNG